ncbi:MAG: EamA family transporter [Chloroflexota bacterium]|nr:MAG: EamA family transporter [Chloroflexota bacterium]HDD61629.1 DMT family transporter [Chloroflexota bacterium]
MEILYLGELAAIITSITFAVNSTLFTVAGRVVGSTVVNRVRLVAACLFLTCAHWIFLGSLWPVGVEWDRWFWLGLSGIVGLVLGDAFLFQAFLWVGPRLSMLMMSLAPIIAAATAWIFLGETLSLWQISGILITLIGIGWVVMEKNKNQLPDKENYLKGILFGLGGAAGQGLGVVLAKLGLDGSFSPISANFIRMFTAMIVIWAVTLFQKEFKNTFNKVVTNPKALWGIIGGAFSGPFLGVSLSLFALQHTSIGVASTLMALPPIFLLPVEKFIFKEKVGWGAVVGTVIAMVGVGVLFLL